MSDYISCRFKCSLLLIAFPDWIIHARRITPCHQDRNLRTELGQLKGASDCRDDSTSCCARRTEASHGPKCRITSKFVGNNQGFLPSSRPCDQGRVLVFSLLIDGEGHRSDESNASERCQSAYMTIDSVSLVDQRKSICNRSCRLPSEDLSVLEGWQVFRDDMARERDVASVTGNNDSG